MTLVERFIEFQQWPTSRKTVWLTGLALAAQIPLSLLWQLAVMPTGLVDNSILSGMLLAGLLILVVCQAAGQAMHRAGRDGRWTAYLVVAAYGGWIGAIIVMFGSFSSALLAWVPTVVILVTLWYDETVGWCALVYSLVLIGTLLPLQSIGLLPFAPAILDRSLDAQRAPGWVMSMLAAFFGLYLYGFLLSVLVIRARRVQDARLNRAHAFMRRFVPSQLADKIINGEHSEASRPQRVKLTIFFSDLVGFTDIAEELEPEDLSRVLNEYFAAMTDSARKHGGTVDELTGDAILIFFGAPNFTDDKDHALRAARMAIAMQQAMIGLNAKWRAAGITESLQVRMGINTGVVTIGNFGSPDRMKYAALGKHVNVAARLQALCEPGKVLLSHSTWLLVNDQIGCVERGEIQLKGIHKPVISYELAVT